MNEHALKLNATMSCSVDYTICHCPQERHLHPCLSLLSDGGRRQKDIWYNRCLAGGVQRCFTTSRTDVCLFHCGRETTDPPSKARSPLSCTEVNVWLILLPCSLYRSRPFLETASASLKDWRTTFCVFFTELISAPNSAWNEKNEASLSQSVSNWFKRKR